MNGMKGHHVHVQLRLTGSVKLYAPFRSRVRLLLLLLLLLLPTG